MLAGMLSLTYVSSAVKPFSAEDLRELLQVSRRNNDAAGITGLLLYKHGNFMQVLEGEESAVLETKKRIQADPRHRGILVLLSRTSSKREFGSWSMAYRNLDTAEGTVEGYDDFLNTPLTDARFRQDPSASQRLLHVFKRSM